MEDGLLTAKDRKALRRWFGVPCRVTTEDGSLLAEWCLDMSPEGMRVIASAEASLGTRVDVAFRVPDAGVHMDARAEVTRIERGRRRGDLATTLGLCFVELSELERAILDARLCGLPPPPPARPLRRDYAAAVRAIHATFCSV